MPPEIVTEESDLAKTLSFSAVFDLSPEIVVNDYQGLNVPRPQVEVSDDEVQKTLEDLRERPATLKKVEDRTRVEHGDLVLAEIEGFADGKPLEGAKIRSAHPRSFLRAARPWARRGADRGRSRPPAHATRSYAADYAEKDLAGKTVEWRAKVKEIYTKVLPALDDEFAKDQGDVASLDELRDKVREQLMQRAREEADCGRARDCSTSCIERNRSRCRSRSTIASAR